MFTSSELTEGDIYTRADLIALFHIHDATINTGIFQPSRRAKTMWTVATASCAALGTNANRYGRNA